VGLQQVILELFSRKPETRAVPGEVIPQLVTVPHNGMRQLTPIPQVTADEEERRSCSVPPELGENQRGGLLIGPIVQGERQQAISCGHPIQAPRVPRGQCIQ
jgi:hypothetical protein